MAPKRARTTQSSSSNHSKTFSTQDQERNCNPYYVDIEIFESYYLDEKLVKEFNFFEAFTMAGLRNIVFGVP